MVRGWRFLQSSGLVAVWMAIGWRFRLDANAYLLVGVPLLLVFQWGVRRQPLATLWLRDHPSFHLDRRGVLMSVGLAVVPAIQLVSTITVASWSIRLWLLCALVGAFAAGFTLQHCDRAMLRALCYCLATAGLIGSGIMVGTALLQQSGLMLTGASLRFGVNQFLLYAPVLFVLEEVAFRGLLDSHLHQPEDAQPWLSAWFVSALWGVWHLPILPIHTIAEFVVSTAWVIFYHSAIGIFLSFGWRRSGNLAVPVIVHALIDAVRNMFLLL